MLTSPERCFCGIFCAKRIYLQKTEFQMIPFNTKIPQEHHSAQNEQRKQQLPNEDGYQDDDYVDYDHYPDRDDDFLRQYHNAVTRRKFERENQGPPRDKLDEDQWDVRSGEPQPDIANEGPIFRGSFPNDGTYGNGKPVGNWPGN
ncbi:hypothetical protein Ddc_02565 [Ditylenchus destructor]|nr:hypothetical protein Ddc_02565 [Ditylenchus destructor]